MRKINLRKINLRFFKRLPAREKKITWSTMFTLARIALVPFIIGCMIVGYWGTAFVLFLAAALTDVIDGNLARLLNEKTFLGACLDPIADKFLILAIFATFAFVAMLLFSIPSWFVWLVLCKEMLLLGGAVLVYRMQGHITVQPTILGKVTTLVQIIFIVWLFACYFFHWLPVKTYYTMLGIVLVLVFASFIDYMRIGFRMLCSLYT